MGFELWMIVPAVIIILFVYRTFFIGGASKCECGRYLNSDDKDGKCKICENWKEERDKEKANEIRGGYDVPCTVCMGEDKNCLTCNGTGWEWIKEK